MQPTFGGLGSPASLRDHIEKPELAREGHCVSTVIPFHSDFWQPQEIRAPSAIGSDEPGREGYHRGGFHSSHRRRRDLHRFGFRATTVVPALHLRFRP